MKVKGKRGRPPNTSETIKVHPSLSAEAYWMLGKLKEMGIYGRSQSEIAARFIEQAYLDSSGQVRSGRSKR
jgi:hypothetical protein